MNKVSEITEHVIFLVIVFNNSVFRKNFRLNSRLLSLREKTRVIDFFKEKE